MDITAGVYWIRNKANNYIYIGSSANIFKRWQYHRQDLIRGAHPSPHLQRAWNLYGPDVFEFDVLIICDPSMCRWYEQQFIDQWKPEYNGTACATGFEAGREVSQETRDKISQALTGYKHDPATYNSRREMFAGENNPAGHKLTKEDALRIREMEGKQRDIAAQFGVSQKTVFNIKHGYKWLR